jgi:butyryl-CoA dehydrogenase
MRKTTDFLLHDWLDVTGLCARPRFQEHSRETFDSVIDMCERIAAEKFAPFNRTADVEEPKQVGDAVILPACSHAAAQAYVDSGMLAAVQDAEFGGMQLPYVIELAANAFFAKAAIGLGGGSMLTVGNINLLMEYGTEAQKRAFAQNEIDGRWFGTMCLSEPQAGSSLSDILTRAVPDGEHSGSDALGPRFRLTGNKMWISNGEHDLAENIVHLVLAKIPAPDGRLVPGTRGISLFIVPKWMVDANGRRTGVRNDVALAGLNHKLGYRGMPNALLNFGEGRYPVSDRAGAIGYLVGQAGEGLKYMFRMMNEARIGVGLGAVGIGYAGFEASLAYARDRRQGRHPGAAGKDPGSPPVRIIEHADVKRMLLAQKSYVEGGLALELYCGRLVDECRTSQAAGDDIGELHGLLELLTPVAKSWPSEWCLAANDFAIQIHGGYGYTRDFPVEQLWRDNRLNMIHEGAHAIHGIDLLGRKVRLENGRALQAFAARVRTSAGQASGNTALAPLAASLVEALDRLLEATRDAWATERADEALANATPYLQAFGHVVIAWIWLDLARIASSALQRERPGTDTAFLHGKVQAAQYFYDYELTKVAPWLVLVATRNPVCAEMQDEWFAS